MYNRDMETRVKEKNNLENKKREFILHIMQIKRYVNLQKMLGRIYTTWKNKCIYTF